MASCLGCGSRLARVVHARALVVVEEMPDCIVVEWTSRRITDCPACGSRRWQRIVDEGPTRRWSVPVLDPAPAKEGKSD